MEAFNGGRKMVRLAWKKDKIKIVMWGIMALLLLFCFVSMYYSDIWSTYHDSLKFIDSLMAGRIFEYYEVNVSLYFVPVYIIFGIWLFPIWFMSYFFHIDINSVGCFIWSKGLIVVFAVGCIWLLYSILKKLEYDNLEYAVFLFVSSLLFIFPSMVAVQYDVIELFFLLLAVFYYIKDKKLSWKPLLFFSVAISIKLFALFVFLILVLTIEKRVLYIIRNMLIGVSFAVITMAPFWNRGYWSGTGGRNISFAYTLLSVTLPGGLSPISIFWLGYFMLCAVAYFSKKKEMEENLKLVIWLTAVFFLLLFGFANCHPYWIVLYLPFLIMVILEHKENLKINILIETVFEIIVILMQGVEYNWVYFSGMSFTSLILKNKGIMADETANLLTFLNMSEGGIASCMIAGSTTFIACGVVLLAINNPWKPVLCESTEKEFVMVKKVSRIARVGIVALLLGLTLVIAF